jgi:hypothetical protein
MITWFSHASAIAGRGVGALFDPARGQIDSAIYFSKWN